MSVLGIAGSSLVNFPAQDLQGNGSGQSFQQEFKQLGQDLQSGNVSAAQADITVLQQDRPQLTGSNGATAQSPVAQEFQQLSQDLQSGNVTQAQQAYTSIQQDFQNQGASDGHAHVRHEHSSGQNQNGAISQLFSQLGSALQTGNLTNAQQIYSSLAQDLLEIAGPSGPVTPTIAGGGSGTGGTAGVSVSG
jgi:hypothetical protein